MKTTIMFILLFFTILIFSCKKERKKSVPNRNITMLNNLVKIEIPIDSCLFEYYSKVESQSRVPGPSDMVLVTILYYSNSNYLTIKKILEEFPIDESKYYFLEHYQIFDKRNIRNWLPLDIKECLQSDTITFYQPIPYINNKLKFGKCLLCPDNRVFLFME